MKKLVQKVVSRESFSYRKLTDVLVGDDEANKRAAVPMEVDAEKLAAGMRNNMICRKVKRVFNVGRLYKIKQSCSYMCIYHVKHFIDIVLYNYLLFLRGDVEISLSICISCKRNSSLMDEVKLMKLYTAAIHVYNISIYTKEDIPSRQN